MKPAGFSEVNIVLGEKQDQYNDLPAFYTPKDLQGRIVTSWSLTFRERIRVLFRGRVWLSTLTFRDPLQPVFMTTEKTDLIITPKMEIS